MRNQILQQEHTGKRVEMQVVMPLNLETRIEADESVRTLIEVTERLDYNKLYRTYQRMPRYGDASPKQLFQIVVLGFMQCQRSTRKIQSACRNDIRFMYLLRGARAPEHSRIARFIQRHLGGEVAEDLFYQLVLHLEELGEIKFEHLFGDGSKLEANANRYSFVWAKLTNKYEARVDEKLAALEQRLTRDYAIIANDFQDYLAALQGIKTSRNVVFVHGRGKRKSQLQRDIEELESLLARKTKYTSYNATFKGRNSFSKTDKDATFMRMKEDHMMNGQLKPGYNLQLGVEGGYIVGASIGPERSDELALFGLLTRMDQGLSKRHKTVTLDAGYESEENYKMLAQRGQTAYIKPQNYERSKTRKYRNNVYLKENMAYDPAADTYICPEGNTFARLYDTTRKSKSGFVAALTVYECSGCLSCPQKPLCTKAKDNRRLYVSKDFIALREASRARITSDLGKTLRLNRSIQTEGAFGVLKEDYGFRRFLRRGEDNVFTEFLLHAMAFDLNKLHAKIMRGCLGYTLHLLSSA